MMGEELMNRPLLLRIMIMLIVVGILINDEKAIAGETGNQPDRVLSASSLNHL